MKLRLASIVPFLAAACSEAPAPTASKAEAGSPAAARIEFVDVAERAGLSLVQVSGDPRRWYIPESNGTGAAWLDYDGDGDMDLFIGNGQGLKYVDDGARLELERTARCALYRNDGGLRFTDVSAQTGCDRTDWVQAIATADCDNDGDTDLYLGCFGADVLLRNDGGKFVDATAEAGIKNERWSSGAAFADVDNDGWLDLYVANYCEFDLASPPNGGKRNVIKGVEVGWGPEEENKQGFNPGAQDVLFLGVGGGKFREATAERGLALEKPLCSYAAIFSDIDLDGDQDLLVANDMQPSNLFLNDGKGHFREESGPRGFAVGGDGKPTSAMGLVSEDADGDGDFDIFRTNFDFEPNCLHVNDGKGHFSDRARALGLAASTMDKLAWGGGFFDAENDGDLDVLVANGHVYPQAKEIGMSGWKMETQLFEAVRGANGQLVWIDATVKTGGPFVELHSARGVAFGDPDDDGDVDAVVIDLDERPRLLENRSVRGGRWLAVKLAGARSNRDGIGARVTVKAGGRSWVREMRTTQGLYSSHDPRLHFGLGPVDKIEEVQVLWPSGARSTVRAPALDSILAIAEDS
ncbi:MAG: CRTAC1 family protein [Planctomycetaceae bacterium]|nr:CRTAC1 family protein [Planctomycetaceae bacterium]